MIPLIFISVLYIFPALLALMLSVSRVINGLVNNGEITLGAALLCPISFIPIANIVISIVGFVDGEFDDIVIFRKKS